MIMRQEKFATLLLRFYKKIKAHSDDINKQGHYFNELLAEEPDWLNDEDYRYGQ